MTSTMNSCVIVTGASRGIGAAIAASLAGHGNTVACLSRSGTQPEINGLSEQTRSRFVTISCDVTNADSVRAAIAKASQQGLRISGLVNNAGVHLEGKSEEFPLADWQRVMDTNATSILIACQAVFPHLVAGGGGLIVNIGSFFDKLGVKRNLAYCASKAAVGAITRCLAIEWAKDRIRVLDVAPGYIVTDLNKESMSSGPLRAYLEKRIPAGQPGTAEDVAELVRLLFDARGGFLTGETIYIDGAQGVAH
jgi:NAD(P)-dependent dehydrogenase (short-subunit alcohol dehydrogenase family)